MTEVKPITTVFSEEGDNLVVLYADDNPQTFKAFALTVNQSVRRIERPQNLPVLSEGGSLQFGYFADSTDGTAGHSADVSSPGEDALAVEDNRDETIIEYGIGVQPDDLLVGLEVAGDPVYGFQGPVERENTWDNTPSEMEFRGGVWSTNTMTETDHAESVPTTALAPNNRQGVLRFDPDSGTENTIRTMYLNPNDEDAPLSVIVYGRAYHVVNITDDQTVRDMFFGDGYKRRILQYGGWANTNPTLPDKWEPGVVTLTGDEIRQAISGGSN